MNQNNNPFGPRSSHGTSPFGQTKPSHGGSPFSPTPGAPVAPAFSPAPATSHGARRRVVSDEAAPATGVAAPEVTDDRAFVSGQHFCHLHKVGSTKSGAHFFEVRLVGGEFHGKTVTVWQGAKNSLQAKELRELYLASGYPESSWQRDANGKPVQPVPSLFLRSLGGGVWVPILMLGAFELRPNPRDTLNPFQKILSFRPVVSRYTDADGAQESLIIAPLPNLLPAAVGHAYGFAGVFYDWGGMRPTAEAMLEIDSVFERENEFTRLDGSSSEPIDLDNPREVIE